MSLKHDIQTMQQQMLPSISQDTLSSMQQATQDLIDSNLASKAQQVGQEAPNFNLCNTKGEVFTLKEQLKHGPVVINFYRGRWCPYCQLELLALDKVMPNIHQLGASLVSICANTLEHSTQLMRDNPFNFDILVDEENHVAKQFHLIFKLAEALKPIYQEFGIHLPDYDGNERYELPIPATYIINPQGIITHSFINPDYTQRMEPKAILQALQSLK